MVDWSKRIEDLSPEKRALFLMRLKKIKETRPEEDERIPRRSDPTIFPLSNAQQRMWFLSQWEPESPFYNIPSILHITGPLDIGALKNAIMQVYNRHEVLRSRFDSIDGKPVQTLRGVDTLCIQSENWSSLTSSEKNRNADNLVSAEMHNGFDLSSDSLIRCKIIEYGDDEYYLFIIMHHIVSDGWSVGIFIKEVSLFYDASLKSSVGGLPELTIQYPDYADWQKQRLQPPYLVELVEYWKNQLMGEQEFLELPLDFARPSIQSFKGAHLRFTFPDGLRDRLVEFSKRQEVSLFMFLLAGFQVLLFRYTNQDDIRVGIPVANRNRKELEEIIGLFVNTIVIKGNLSQQLSFVEFLNQIKERVLGGYTHQELPFEMLLEELSIIRDLSHTPLFQVMFALQPAALKTLKLSNLDFEIIDPENGTSKFDLTLFIEETEQGLDAIFEYNTGLFLPESISRMADHLVVLFTGILENENQILGRLPLLTSKEREKLLISWNNQLTDYPSEINLSVLFENAVEKYPESIAVSFPLADQNEITISYRELNHQVNQLARYLRRYIDQPGNLVALFMDRSLDMVIATLAILKAGCAYLPIDLGYPQERVAFMLQDGQVPVIVTNTAHVGLLKNIIASVEGSTDIKIVCPNDGAESEIIAQESPQNLGDYPPAETIAYVMYTSGSTGKPKGVAVPHRAIARLVINTNYLEFGPGQRIAHISNPSFDAATFEIWGALLHGGQLVGIPKEIALNTGRYVQFIREKRISATFLTVALFNHIVREDPDAFQTMDTLMFGGEAADLSTIRRVLEHRGPRRLVNGYGPTESTTFATWYFVEQLPDHLKSIPIGRPISNTLLYVLDQNLEPVPIGVPGELYIGGDGLALGYFRRPELTAEKFIPNPFIHLIQALPGVQVHENRIYKTGDRVRYLSDGNIEFLGRLDFQVKMRGLRIELGEIETAMGSHPSITGNIVLLREDIPGEKRLVSYYLTKDSSPIDANELREFLKPKLPDFMIPSGFVFLESFPLNPNGKIDRKLLPVPDELSLSQSEDFIPPATPDEEILSSIWQELLGYQRIGIRDNFFALGGHSLLVTQLVSRIRTLFAVDLQIKNIFEHPTIHEQAVHIGIQRASQSGISIPDLLANPRDGELPLTFSQQRLWFLEQLKPGSPDYNIPTSVRITGHLDEVILVKCLQELVVRHESLRMVVHANDGKPEILILPTVELPYRSLDFRDFDEKAKEKAIETEIQAEAQHPFSLSQGPLARFLCIRLSDEQYQFLLVFHHIISDGWSANIFYRELSTLYRAFVNGEQSPLQSLPYQYVDFAIWQRKLLQGDYLEGELNYWKTRLGDAPQLLELPTDFVRPSLQSGQGDFIPFEIDRETTQKITEQCAGEGVTLFMYLLSIFNVLLHRYTDQTDLCIGTPIANRDHEGIEGIIGFFVNTLVIRTGLDGDPTFADVLHQVRSTAMDAYTHSLIPFEMVVDAVDPVRDLSFNPIFQVMFAFQEDSSPAYHQLQSSLKLDPIDVHGGISIFDLTLSVARSGDHLRGAIEYSSDLFRPETIHRMVAHLQLLINGFLSNPAIKISEPSLLTDYELEKIQSWNQTSQTIPQVCLHELFHEVAIANPDQIAILEAFSEGKKYLSYRELDDRSDKLAMFLKQNGIGPGKIVGLCLERTFDLYVGLLGILKSGAAYLPLDPTYPKERLDHMINDSQVSVIVSQESLLDYLREFNVQVIDLANDWDKIVKGAWMSAITAPRNSDTIHPAYIIYTSGSTGKPKGVLVSHRSVVNHNLAMKAAFKLEQTDRVLQFSTINFDAAVEEIFPTWFSGATVVIPPLSMITRGSLLITPKELNDLVITEQVTILDFSTAFWHEWVHELVKFLEFPACVRLVVVGGEKARRDVYDKWLQIVPDKVVWLNTYGPTEAAIVATVYQPEPLLPLGQEIPIGKPITNLRAHILDRHQNIVPIGLPGELYLGGVGVAIGYLNQPELNASKFFPDILFPDERMYKTGDKVRWRSDGNVEFMGRVDSQVKIRGFRIEVDEIENNLMAYPGIKDAVVIPVKKSGEGNSGSQMLAAYVVSNQPGKISEGELRTFLKTKVPDYMTPGVICFIDNLPRLPNGKVDRKGLPEPEVGIDPVRTYIAPSDDIQEALVGIWKDVLGLHRIGIYDNFFELGGDSILSIQVVSRAMKIGYKLQPRHLFEAQTIAELSRFVEKYQGELRADQGEVIGDVQLTPIQGWFFEQKFPQYWHWNQAVLVEVKRPLDVQILQYTLGVLLSHHDALRLRFRVDDDGRRIGHIEPSGGDLPFQVVDLTTFDEPDREWRLSEKIQEIQASLDIEKGPIIRLVYFRFDQKSTDRLFMVIHHLAIDGVSWRILFDDLRSLYDQFSRGISPTLTPKSTSIKAWSELLSEYAQNEAFSIEASYWQKILEEPVQSLPTDYRDQTNLQADEGIVQVFIDVPTTNSLLRELPITFGADINDALICVLVKTLTIWAGSSSIRIDLEGHGREDIIGNVDLSRTVGWFTSVYPVTFTMNTKMSLTDSLIAIKEKIRSIPHNGINFGVIRYLKSASSMNIESSEVSYNYLGQVTLGNSDDEIFSPARESTGHSLGLKNHRSHLLDFIASIVDGRLCLEWRYSEKIHKKETIETIADNFRSHLLELHRKCSGTSSAVYSPSDFKDVALRQDEIDLLMQELGFNEGEDTDQPLET